MDQEKRTPKWTTGFFDSLNFSVFIRLFHTTHGCCSIFASVGGFRSLDALKKNSNI